MSPVLVVSDVFDSFEPVTLSTGHDFVMRLDF